jgi:hypothetical protein
MPNLWEPGSVYAKSPLRSAARFEGNRRFATHVPLPKPTLDDFGVVRIQRSYPTPVSIPRRTRTCRISGRPSRARGRLFRTLPSRWHRCSVSICLIGKERSRDPAFHVSAGEEARARRWPPVNGARFEVDRFGRPKQIVAMIPAALPCVVVAGSLVIPSNARDRLPERAPGRLLPTTRVVIFVAAFAVVVARQLVFDRAFRPTAANFRDLAQVLVHSTDCLSSLLGWFFGASGPI